MKILEEVLSACVSSAKSEPIKLVEHKRDFMLHSQLHVMMTMPSGSFKSTILKSIPKKTFVDIQDYTLPALVGSIGQNGLVKGYVMKAAGKCLPVDEFHSLDEKARKALLSLTEDQKATRLFGYDSRMSEKKSGRYLKYRIDGNEIHIDYVRCSVLLSGIYAPHKRRDASPDDFAFSSRFLPVTLKPTFEELDDVMMGKRKILEIKYLPYSEAPVFEDFNKFVVAYRETIKNLPRRVCDFFLMNTEFYNRLKLHFAKFFAWKNRNNSTIEDWEKYLPYIPYFAYSTIASTLTFGEFEIYDLLCRGMKQQEIAEKLQCSKQYISKIVKNLRIIGLIGDDLG